MDDLRTDTLGGKPPSRNGHGIDRGRLPMIGIEYISRIHLKGKCGPQIPG